MLYHPHGYDDQGRAVLTVRGAKRTDGKPGLEQILKTPRRGSACKMGELAMHQVRMFLWLIWFLVCGAALAADDCAIRMPMSNMVPELSRGCPEEKVAMEKKARECVPISGVSPTNSYSKIEIIEPGHYCLTEDLHTRIELADRPAEGAMIIIRANNVVLDLQGHTLGRGKAFKNPGGEGIHIGDSFSGIRIMNGLLQDFRTGIYRDSPRYPAIEELPIKESAEEVYRFPIAGIVVENVTFKNTKEGFRIRIPREPQR